MKKTLPSSILLALLAVPSLPAPMAAQNDDLLVVEKRNDLAARNRLLGRLQKIIVTVNFEDATAKDVVRYLQAASGNTVNFIVSTRTTKADDLPKLTLRLKSVSLANVMSVIEQQTGLRFTYSSSLVFLKPKDEVKEFAYLRIYDVRAAVMPVPNFKGPKLGLRPPGEEEAVEEEEEPKPILFDSDKIIDLIRTNVVTDSWDKEGISIDAMRGVLLVRQTVKGHKHVHDLLVKLGAIPATRRIVRRPVVRRPAKKTAPKVQTAESAKEKAAKKKARK